MKPTTQRKKLVLSRETLRTLTPDDLAVVRGGSDAGQCTESCCQASCKIPEPER